jgi:hypothetical protein
LQDKARASYLRPFWAGSSGGRPSPLGRAVLSIDSALYDKLADRLADLKMKSQDGFLEIPPELRFLVRSNDCQDDYFFSLKQNFNLLLIGMRSGPELKIMWPANLRAADERGFSIKN